MSATRTPSSPATDENGFPTSYEDGPAGDGTFPLVSATDATTEEDSAVVSATEEAPAAANGKAKTKKPKAPKKSGGKSAALVGVAVPKGRLVELDHKQLVFDRRVQMRASLHDDAVVEKYRELYQEGHEFPPLMAVEIPAEQQQELGLSSPYVVWDGFQRGEARLRAKLTRNIPVEVSKGDWMLALRLGMVANADHGAARTTSDLRRLFGKLLENETLLAQVLAEGKGKGGANRALSAAANISKGLVSKILNSMGKTTRGDRVVNIEQQRRGAKKGARTDPKSHEFREDPATIAKKVSAVIIQEMCNAAASLQRRYEALFEREDAIGIVKEVAAQAGHPVREDQNPTKKPGEDKTTIAVTRHWPVVDDLLDMMDAIKAEHEKTNTKPTA